MTAAIYYRDAAGQTPWWDQRTPHDLAVEFKNKTRLTTVISAHAPTLHAEEDLKDLFYSQLD